MITDPKQLTPEILTNILRDRGFLYNGYVTGVASLLTRELPVSFVSRLKISFSADAAAHAPKNLFLKMSANGLALEHSGKEVEFYTQLAPQMSGGPLIRCFATEYSPESHQYYLLLEDLSESHTQSESPFPPSEERSIGAVEALAEVHAHWWNRPKLGGEIGTVFDAAWLESLVTELDRSVIAFMDFLGDELSPQRRKMYEHLLDNKYAIWGRLTDARGLTLTHGDVHWWNFLYPRDGVDDKVRLFDCTLWHIDLGPRPGVCCRSRWFCRTPSQPRRRSGAAIL